MDPPVKLSRLRYALQSLWYYRRVNVAVLLGVIAATAVLSGALIVGDSVRSSLRRLTIERLGASTRSCWPTIFSTRASQAASSSGDPTWPASAKRSRSFF